MSENTKPDLASTKSSESPSNQLRLFIELPSGWWRLPVAQVLPVYTGVQAIPELAGKTVRAAFADITWMRGKVRSLVRLDSRSLTFDHKGLLKTGLLVQGMAEKMDRSQPPDRDATLAQSSFSEADVAFFRRSLGLGEVDT